MEHKQQYCISTITFLVFLFIIGLYLVLHTPDTFSESERRLLAKKPELNMKNVGSGSYMKDFEDFALDHFPFRESMRRTKAMSELYLFHKSDNNDLYIDHGQLSKMDFPLQEDMVRNAENHVNDIYDLYLKDKNIQPYFVIVPDKNYYLAPASGKLYMNYDRLYKMLQTDMSYMRFIEIRDLLEIDDYYKTDTHWRQERILDVAERVASGMGTDVSAEYEQKELLTPFYGVYTGQSALPVKPDNLIYMTNDILKNCVVTVYTLGKPEVKEIYDMDKAVSKDPYEMFLSGATPIVTIENPNSITDKELVIVRDSFGGSIAPFFVQGYAKITLVDIRYMQSNMIGSFIDFEDQDVLFLYSTLLLNNSSGLR